MYHYLKYYPISILTIAVILYLSFFTPPETQAQEIPYIDKIVHFCMYGGLTSLLWLEYNWHHKDIHWTRLIVGGALCPIIMSGLIEIGQSTLTETRSGEWMDFVANTSGVLAACIVSYYAIRMLKRKKSAE